MSHRFPAPPGWTGDDVAALLAAGPDEHIAFLPASANAARLAETLVALANAHGGMAVFGIAPSGRPQGIADPDEALDTVQAAELLATPPLIIPVPQMVEYADRRICLIEVPPGLPHAYSLNGRYLTRTGTNNRLLSSAELAGLLLPARRRGSRRRPPMPRWQTWTWPRSRRTWAAAGPGRRDLAARCKAGGGPTRAMDSCRRMRACCVLAASRSGSCAAHDPRALPGPVMGDQLLRQDATGTLPDQIRQAEAFISANMRRDGWRA